MNLQQIRYKVEQLKGQRAQLVQDKQTSIRLVDQYKQDLLHSEEARAVIQIVSEQTQAELQYHVSEIVSLALAAVFDDPYKLLLEFTQRRNKVEADLWFVRGDEKIKPMEAAGGGAVDVAAFALRVAMWSLKRPKSRGTLILDEPLRFLSRDLMPKAAVMLSEVSKKLNLQIIMVSHSPELIEGADKYFEVTMNRRISNVKEGARITEYRMENTSRQDNTRHRISTSKKQQGVDEAPASGVQARTTRRRKDIEEDHNERSADKQIVVRSRRRS
jgi:DNA repair exonuclease SbcCD ATPase subunit